MTVHVIKHKYINNAVVVVPILPAITSTTTTTTTAIDTQHLLTKFEFQTEVHFYIAVPGLQRAGSLHHSLTSSITS